MLLVSIAVMLGALAAVVRYAPRGHARTTLLVLVLASSAGFTVLGHQRAREPEGAQTMPRERERGVFMASGGCQACHPSEAASWMRSYHRTMTQRAKDGAVLAPVGVHDLSLRGERVIFDNSKSTRTIRWASTDVVKDVLLTTGSHHYQAYWTEGARAGELAIAPFVWHREAERFIPRHDVFLQPEDQADAGVKWNSNCLQCHATQAEPRHELATDSFDTRVVELGIACEACHGPGGHHVSHYQDPFVRAAASPDDPEPARFIVNPSRLDGERASEVCGQCHAYAYPRDENAWWSAGYTKTYTPGEALAPSRKLITPESLEAGGDVALSHATESLYWGDGTIRVGGREWNGLSASGCHLRGEAGDRISCLSCHTMHAGDPNDQLKPTARGNGACVGCHADYDGSAHSRHDDAVTCYSCHMPRVSYALYRAQRSHRIDSPDVDAALEHGRPPACNLCHVHESLAWTNRELERGWGRTSRAVAPPESPELGYALALALRGDAAQRVVVADHLLEAGAMSAGSVGVDAREVSVLAVLLEDPYAAIRFVAQRKLVDRGVLEPGRYDFIGAGRHRREVSRSLLAADPSGLSPGALARELGQRDDRPITIAE